MYIGKWLCNVPISRGTETLLRRIYASWKCPHVYMLSSVQAKIRVPKYVAHYTFQHKSIITKLSQDVTQYYNNIISPIGANARI